MVTFRVLSMSSQSALQAVSASAIVLHRLAVSLATSSGEPNVLYQISVSVYYCTFVHTDVIYISIVHGRTAADLLIVDVMPPWYKPLGLCLYVNECSYVRNRTVATLFRTTTSLYWHDAVAY